jgi:beta-phosphoglucomutase-like phosphatase (HAD superfamily)
MLGFPIEAIIFDMDGLMLDSESLYQAAWQAAAADLGYALHPEMYVQLVGRSSAEAEQTFVEMFGDRFPLGQFNRQWENRWREVVTQQGIPLKPGLLPLLDWVDTRSLPKAVGTSSDAVEAHLSLTVAGIRDRFTILVTVDQVAAGKPAPDIFQEAARRLGVLPARCLVLEDSNAGVQAAQAAGMPVVMVPDLQTPSAATIAISQQIFTSLHEVLTWLQAVDLAPC